MNNPKIWKGHTEIIEAILRWAAHNSADLMEQLSRVSNLSARVLWICGAAGSGESRISHSVAVRLQRLERLGSLYCCYYKNRETLNPTSLFGAITRHLADRDPLRKPHIVATIRDIGIQRTKICQQQYRHFIVAPSADLPVVISNTVMVIDAIGSVHERVDALEILTKRAHELPDGLRIVVTSRFERDIQETLQSPEAVGVDCMLGDIPASLTLSVYVPDGRQWFKFRPIAKTAGFYGMPLHPQR
jgi:hypothetical protein